MRKTIIIFYLICFCFTAFAIPAYHGKRTATQPDGSEVEYFVHGDEVYHYMTDSDGCLLERNIDGFLTKAGVAPTEKQIMTRRATSVLKHTQPRKIGGSNLISKGLVILVNFSDTKFQTANTRDAFDEMLNGDFYRYNGATGSVRKYYSDQSGGDFAPSFDVYGPVTISRQAEWYGNSSYQSRIGTMVKEAVIAAKDTFDIDFSNYDADDDGYVDFVDILYAGYGAADSNYSNTVWPCEWSLKGSGNTTIKYDGKTIDTFSCHQELCGYGGSKGKRAGIGTCCHEFAHVFGLPDFYDTTYKNATMGEWDLMDQGAYNNDGRTPPGFSGYERMFAGWADARLLSKPENVTLQELQSTQQALVVTATGKHNMDVHNPSPRTFYILENRQQKGWDRYLPGHGMLIWKIQYNSYSWQSNTVNNAAVSKQGVALIAADGEVYHEIDNGTVYSYGDAGDSYPGTGVVTSYEGINGFMISDIQENNGNIYFRFMGGEQDPFVVSFDAGEHGTCSTKTIHETQTGSGILLPAVIADEDYLFEGWSTSKDSKTADAGKTGDTYYPPYNITLYAVYHNTNYTVEWDAEHATITPETDLSSKYLTFSVITDEGYIVTIDDIAITMGERDLVADVDFTFTDNILTIPFVDGDIYILVIAQKSGTPSSLEEFSTEDLFEICQDNILRFKTDTHINMYDTSGKLYTERYVRKGESLQLAAGLYLLLTDDKRYYKILIK
ncbi:MAG: M6 family metalloprotease domain-containing protein [Paludibacteraceae bacterium]|nr:M6 family metalloprotease domain-containing protein [Paludibacteraceae bacterium]